jgi:pimeloyl-ACP methyl ester carboxylesterase
VNSFWRGVLAATAATLTLAGADGPKAGDLTIEPYAFRLESGLTVDAELGRLAVPQTRSNPLGPVTTIAFVRFRSTSDTPGAPIFYLAGGPGASGIDDSRGNLSATVAALQTVGDVIVIDQRGTGLSTPDLNVHATFGVAPGDPLSSPSATASLEEALQKASRELLDRGTELSAYNTNESADDLDMLRVALGVDRVRVWAHSYGTHLALAFVRRHEPAVDRIVMGGINGPNHRWRLPADADRLFARLAPLLQADPRWGPRIPDLRGLVSQVLSGLAEHPVSITLALGPDKTTTVTLGKDDVQVLTALQLGDIDFIRAIPALFFGMANNNYSTPAAILLALKASEIGPAVRYTMHCASGVSAERLALIDSQKEGALLGNAINFPFSNPHVCEAWNAGDLGPDFRMPVMSTIPALFVSATLDGRTSLEDAAEVRAGFPNSVAVVLENGSHGRMFSVSPELTRLMLDFFLEKPVVDQTITLPFSFQ